MHLGQSAAPDLTLPSGVVRARMLSVLGYSNLVIEHHLLVDAYRRMLRHAVAGELRVQHEVVPLAEVDRAWRAQRSAPHRKLVIAP